MHDLILVDANNIGFASMVSPRLHAGGRETNGIFSFVRKIRNIASEYQDAEIIFLYDGKSWRRDIYSEYKANRTQTEKQKDERNAYFEQQKEMRNALKLLGLRQTWATNWEADDLAAVLSRKWGGKVYLLSGDKDWQQLVSPTITWIDPINERRCAIHEFHEVTGFKDIFQFIEAKCILGDPSDNIKGLHGFGPKAVEGMYAIADNFDEFSLSMIRDKDATLDKWKTTNGKIMPKALREADYSEWEVQFRNNWELVALDSHIRPKADKIIDTRGKLHKSEFEEFCNRNGFLSIRNKLSEFLRPFENNPFISK